ncbi:alpha/beta fold hydrolase [Corynebacterium aquilae]|uniref:alpha/beta fold hydrolase n=1 Tax=Corynebacterium aquilae TaxID=203263 RepID=UPI001FE4591C|nr:alpha/beta fold hydrolase [Corynebacterium aquilae]
MTTTTTRMLGHTISSHTLDGIFAREIFADGNDNAPLVIFLQGGPGHPSPRPTAIGGWLKKLLERHRVLLLDQRGTGNSGRIDAINPATATELENYRADAIVEDCEKFRQALGLDTVSLFGQSYGGFCITTYLSKHPNSVDKALLTGGLPAVGVHIDDIYRATYTKLKKRHDTFNHQVPWAADRIAEIIDHLDNSDERLSTGERLSSRRFRTIGIELGRGAGFATLAHLLEEPFVTVKGEKKLRGDFLHNVGQRVSFAHAPLYAVMHESIYAEGYATNWSAHRIREEFDCFAENGGTYLTGEHIYPWMFDEDPALIPFKDQAETLAAKADWPALYHPDALANTPATAAAAVYLDDIFVPYEHSMNTAAMFRDLRPHVTNQYQHNGIAENGAGILTRLLELIADH